MENRQEFDLIITGNGAIGNAIALRFNDEHRGLRIALVGSALRPGCASLAAGAMLNVFAELEAGGLDYPAARRKLELCVEATQLWGRHLALLNSRLKEAPPVAVEQGTHVVLNASADRFDDLNFAAIIGYLKEYKQPFREIDPREIQGIRPAPVSRPLRAIYLENEGAVSSMALHRAYDEAFARSPSITLFDTEVEAIHAGGRAKKVKLRDGRQISSEQIVIAAGSATQKLVEQLGLERKIPRLVLGVGSSLILKSKTAVPAKVFRTPNRGMACGVYVVPYADNYCYVGATNFICPWEVPLPRVQAVHTLLTAAMDQVSTDFYKAEIHKIIVGYRPTTLDTYPLFGQTSVPGVWIASGTKRDGFHLSPRIAEEIVRCLASGEQPFAGAFVPERKLLLEVPRDKAIERAVAHLTSAGFQHGFRMPHSNWEPLIDDAIRRNVLDAYERSGMQSYRFGIPPEMLDMFRYGHAAANVAELFSEGSAPAAAPDAKA